LLTGLLYMYASLIGSKSRRYQMTGGKLISGVKLFVTPVQRSKGARSVRKTVLTVYMRSLYLILRSPITKKACTDDVVNGILGIVNFPMDNYPFTDPERDGRLSLCNVGATSKL